MVAFFIDMQQIMRLNFFICTITTTFDLSSLMIKCFTQNIYNKSISYGCCDFIFSIFLFCRNGYGSHETSARECIIAHYHKWSSDLIANFRVRIDVLFFIFSVAFALRLRRKKKIRKHAISTNKNNEKKIRKTKTMPSKKWSFNEVKIRKLIIVWEMIGSTFSDWSSKFIVAFFRKEGERYFLWYRKLYIAFRLYYDYFNETMHH